LVFSTFGGYLGTLGFVFDLFSHFRAQYLILSALLTAYFLWRRQRKMLLCSIVCLTVNFIECWPYLSFDGREQPSTDVSNIFFANIDIRNRDYDSLLALVRAEKPRLAVFTEVDNKWAEELSALKDEYPYFLERPAAHKYGMVLYSREPFANEKIYEFPGIVYSSVVFDVTLDSDKRPLRIFAVHTPAPLSSIGYRLRNNVLQEVAKIVSSRPNRDSTTAVLVGDLNITPWSLFFKRLLIDSGLKDIRVGEGLLPTWPTNFVPFIIPIDHCLTDASERLTRVRSTPPFGSDHLGIVCQIGTN